MKRVPGFNRAARSFLTETVRVSAPVTSGSMRGTTTTVVVVAANLRCSIQPRSAFESKTVVGRFTDATEVMFVPALDTTGKPYAFKMDATVEELDGRGRKWTVTADGENYMDVFMVVPLKPALRI